MNNNNQSDKEESMTLAGRNSSKVLSHLEPISFFSKDKSFVFAHQKIEKLVAAIYILTNFFPNDESLKWSLRQLGASLLRTNIELKSGVTQNRETILQDTILEITSLLEVASFAGLVSSMNLSVLKNEFHGLISHIQRAQRGNAKGGLKIEESFFASKELINVDEGEPIAKQETSNLRTEDFAGGIKDKINVLYKDNEEGGDIDQEKSQKLKEFSTVAVKKNKRQSVIIALLRRKKEIMVRDVSLIIRDCSEKTIQRELLSLVEQGVLKKEGERRWTKYTLA